MSRPFVALAALALTATARAQTSYPMITRVEPAAVRRGTAAEVLLHAGGASGGGGDVEGAFAVLAQPKGVVGEVLGVEKVAQNPARKKAQTRGAPRRNRGVVRTRITVAKDAPLGPREVRVATPQGVSSVGLVVVVDDPVVVESDDAKNDDAKGAQPLTLPCVVSGSIGKAEDVDWYAFRAKAGQRLTFAVWANRLENKIHDLQTHFDPILLLHDADGRELAADDNQDLADPRLSYEFKADGEYVLQIRDTTYGGNVSWSYVLQATGGPVASSVFPPAVNPGAKAELRATGPNLDPSRPLTLETPADLTPGPHLFALPTDRGPTLATPLLVTPLPIVVETDDAPEDAAKGQSVTLPAAVAGRLGRENDVDAFRFTAKKGTLYAFEVVARRVGSATDPVLRVLNAKNEVAAEADDTPGLGKDARLEWTAPADAEFALQVADLHSRGGDGFNYVIQAGPAAPEFTITSDPDKVNVGPGGRVPLFVQVTRRGGFAGPVVVNLENLPAGVSASPLTIPPKMTQGLIVVSAAADAKPAGVLLALKGKADTPAGPVVRDASPKQEIYLPGGGRGLYPVETLAMAVTDPSDVTIEAMPKSLTLRPGESTTLDVTITRKPGFELPVNLDVVLQHLGGVHANPLPPGVVVREAGGKTLLGPKETKGKIVLEARKDAAAVDGVPVCVLGNVSVNFVVKCSYASAPIAVTVTPE